MSKCVENEVDSVTCLNNLEKLIFAKCLLHKTPTPSFTVSSSSSSSCGATSSDIPDSLSPLLPVVHHFWLVLRAISRILTELLYVSSRWSPCLCSAMCRVHRRTSLMSSSLLLQQCPACLVRLTWIVFMMGGRWPYSCCFVECCFQDLFKIALSILVYVASRTCSKLLAAFLCMLPPGLVQNCSQHSCVCCLQDLFKIARSILVYVASWTCSKLLAAFLCMLPRVLVQNCSQHSCVCCLEYLFKIARSMLYLVKYIKMLTIFQQ